MSFGDAALGAVTGELLKLVIDLSRSAIKFKSVLNELESTLKLMLPLLNQIESLNQKLDFSVQETEKLRKIIENGMQLVVKCTKVKRWSPKAAYYTKALGKLDTSLKSHLHTISPLLQTRNELLILDHVRRIESNISDDRLSSRKLGFRTCAVPELREEPVGFDGAVVELKRKLLKEGTSKLLVTGPGGRGKTTLAIKFCNDEDVKGKFQDNIFFITFSKKPCLELIIQDIFGQKGEKVRDFQDDVHAIRYLEKFIKELSVNPLLFVIDDAWSGALLEKFEFNIANFKLLVTSRHKLPGFDHPYCLQLLSDEEAMEIFVRAAFVQDNNFYRPDQDLLRKIVRPYKRFPLALRVFGRSLHGKREAVWKDAEKKLSRSPYTLDSDSELLNCFQRSLDFLQDKAVIKESFMDLSSFPEDRRIPVPVFIDICAVLYALDENGAVTALEELFDQNLIDSAVSGKDAYKDDYYNEQFFKQHDVLRQLAIDLSDQGPVEERKRLVMDLSGNDIPEWWSKEKRHPTSALILSIATDKMFSSCWSTLQAPEVKVLILNLRTKNCNLPEFIKTMEKLKVLIVTNYGYFPTELSDNQLLGSLSSLERIRFERISILSLCEKPIRLGNLQKLSFYLCNIDQAFRNPSFNISYAFPNLLELSIDFCNDLVELPDGLCDISLLKKLNITNCHRLSLLPEGIGKLVNLEVLRLKSCTGLLELPDSVTSLRNLTSLDISHCLSITKLPECLGELQSLRKLNVEVCSRLHKLPLSVKALKNLKEVICDKEIALHWKRFWPNLANLVKEYEEDINLDWLNS